ncbi:MAG TPA: protein translocase subunit SecD [Candidatus Krumholzibacteria bacterium]|nr:protein translocase subunit SecD [Candidatus Krumholzibacteria bacterium]
MNRSLQIRAGVTILALLLSVWGLLPTIKALSVPHAEREAAKTDPAVASRIADIDAKAIRRGLDLKGGMYLVLEVDQTGMNASEAQDALQRVKEILTNRIDRFGVSEPEITTFGASRIVVKLPGLQDPERAKKLIGTTAQLEFRMVRPTEELAAALETMDGIFLAESQAEAAVKKAETPAAAPAGTPTETAAAAPDSANPFAELDNMLGEDSDADAQRQAFLVDHPFSGMLVMQNNLSASTPLFVAEDDVDALQARLDDPRVKLKLRDAEFQIGIEPIRLTDGTALRALYLVDRTPSLTGSDLQDANPATDPDRPGGWQVSFTMTNRGARVFAKLTGENIGRFLAISLDGRVKSAPVIQSRIPSGQGVITGSFDNAEASDLALLLRAGALPTNITIAEERTVGPSLGADSIRMGVNAALYGSLLVIVFILLYYRLSGLVSVLALVSNIVILMAVLAQFDLVLTLPGIAGIILTVGMAVDANVLINERIREELRKDKTIRAAVQAGYSNATRTIVDANVTTLIAGGILLWFGTGPIKGFAVTLCIGILTSMFTALVMTRVLMELMTRNQGKQKLSI